jgi:hypothetical protein
MGGDLLGPLGRFFSVTGAFEFAYETDTLPEKNLPGYLTLGAFLQPPSLEHTWWDAFSTKMQWTEELIKSSVNVVTP